jgi:Domain of unknown function (DUF4149)
MNTISSRVEFKRSPMLTALMLTLGFWLSASLVLDWIIMPSLYFSGMMTQSGFATAGYTIFWNFNRIELLAAGLVLTAVLALGNRQSQWHIGAIALSVLLLAVCLLDTYCLTPQMSAIGLQLDLFQASTEIPANMNLLHGGYWVLEAAKLVAGGTLLRWCVKEL